MTTPQPPGGHNGPGTPDPIPIPPDPGAQAWQPGPATHWPTGPTPAEPWPANPTPTEQWNVGNSPTTAWNPNDAQAEQWSADPAWTPVATPPTLQRKGGLTRTQLMIGAIVAAAVLVVAVVLVVVNSGGNDDSTPSAASTSTSATALTTAATTSSGDSSTTSLTAKPGPPRAHDEAAVRSALPAAFQQEATCARSERSIMTDSDLACTIKAGSPLIRGLASPGVDRDLTVWIEPSPAKGAKVINQWRRIWPSQYVEHDGNFARIESGSKSSSFEYANLETGLSILGHYGWNDRESIMKFLSQAGLWGGSAGVGPTSAAPKRPTPNDLASIVAAMPPAVRQASTCRPDDGTPGPDGKFKAMCFINAGDPLVEGLLGGPGQKRFFIGYYSDDPVGETDRWSTMYPATELVTRPHGVVRIHEDGSGTKSILYIDTTSGFRFNPGDFIDQNAALTFLTRAGL